LFVELINISLLWGFINLKRSLLLWAVVFFVLSSAVWAASPEYLVFSQISNGNKTVYMYLPEQKETVTVVSAKEIHVFLKNRHIFYFTGKTLYEYDWKNGKAREIGKFAESDIEMGMITETNGLSQMLIVAKGRYENNWYVLDLGDSSIRPVTQPFQGSGRMTTGLRSQDDRYLAAFKVNSLKGRVRLSVQKKNGARYKSFWNSPKEISMLPDSMVWSPDSKWLAFHAKKSTGFDGFYSMDCLNVETGKLQRIEENVLYFEWISSNSLFEFLPDWSQDSRYLVFQSQPGGSPYQSEIIRFDVTTGNTKTLASSSGQNQNPRFAPSGKYIAFISNRELGRKQLFLMDYDGKNQKRISPAGITDWMEWFRP
jgi:Tol biopolymer transport system component